MRNVTDDDYEWKVVRDLTDYDSSKWLQEYCREAMESPDSKGPNTLLSMSPAYKRAWTRKFLKSLLAERFLEWSRSVEGRAARNRGQRAYDVRKRAGAVASRSV